MSHSIFDGYQFYVDIEYHVRNLFPDKYPEFRKDIYENMKSRSLISIIGY